MRFSLTPDQQLFAEAVRELLSDKCPPERIRAAWTEPQDRMLWQQLSDMGMVGLLAPESHGGLAMGALDLHPLLFETGRVAMPEPIVDTAAVAVPMLTASGHPSLSAVVNGEQTVAVAFATDPVARIDADLLLAQRGDDWHLLRTDSVDHVVETSVDGSRRLGTISWESTESTLVTSGGSAGFLAKDRGVVGLSAQLLGLATHLLEATVEYVKVREQFGKPIGAQQALKHKLADVLLAIEFAGPVVARAAHSLAVADPQASLHASMAKCFAADAAKLTARHALQCHGAIAYTTEFDLHMWMKRVWALAAQWGDANHHRRRVGELLSSS